MAESEFIFKNPVFIGDDQSLAEARAIISYNHELLNAEARDIFDRNNRADFEAEPIHTDQEPIMIDGRQILIWRDRGDPENPEFMFSTIFQVTKNPFGRIDRALCGAIAGEKFQGVVLYRRDRKKNPQGGECCPQTDDAMSALVIVQDLQGVIGWTQRDTVHTASTCKGIFRRAKKGVTRNNNSIAHIYECHVTGKQLCTGSHDWLPEPIV